MVDLCNVISSTLGVPESMDCVPADPRVVAELRHWVACTVCGANDPDAPRPPMFATEDELWAWLYTHPEPSGWVRRDDGRILCPNHRGVADCDEHGHLAANWSAHPLDGDLEWRFCPRCGGKFQQRSRMAT
jgi:hypothetical protein